MSDILHLEDFMAPEQRVHVGVQTFTPRHSVDKHSHDFYELFLVIGGRFSHQINGKKEILVQGHGRFIRSNDSHAIKALDERASLINIAVLAQDFDEWLGSFCNGLASVTVEEKEQGVFTSAIAFDEQLLAMLQRYALDAQQAIDNKNYGMANQYAKLIFLQAFAFDQSQRLLNKNAEMSKISNEIPTWLSTAMRLFESQEPINLSNKTFIQLSGKTYEHVSRSLKKHTGITLSSYVNKTKLNHFVARLTSGDEQINVVAKECGFEDIFYFNRLFRQHFDCTPSQYRKQHRMLFPG